MKDGENPPYDDSFVNDNESDKRIKKPKFAARTSQDQGLKFSLPDDTMVGYHQPSANARKIISNQGPLMIAGTLSF